MFETIAIVGNTTAGKVSVGVVGDLLSDLLVGADHEIGKGKHDRIFYVFAVVNEFISRTG